jgi:putative endonuclease
MAGLVPSIYKSAAGGWTCRHVSPMNNAWVYIMTNRPNGTLYTGVTSDLARRVWEHREGVADGFERLVYVEAHPDIQSAIQREHNMKHWPRKWKVRLILEANPRWDDLYGQLV